jgi:hypothetical protein
LIPKNWIEGAFLALKARSCSRGGEKVSCFSARERKTAKGGSLPAADSQPAKSSLKIILKRAESGPIPCLTGLALCVALYVALEQQEQHSIVAFPTRTEIGQGRQPMNGQSKDLPFTAVIKTGCDNGK